MASHRREVLALADRQYKTDPTFRRLRNFAELQHTACLWDLMPGSVTDEASPFNECAHADLAAVQALLAHMMTMPDTAPATRRIQDAIDHEATAATTPLCRFSDEPFNTADMIGPDWTGVPGHLPTLLVLLATAMLILSAGTGVWAGTHRHGAA